jgi:hypothetical protein
MAAFNANRTASSLLFQKRLILDCDMFDFWYIIIDAFPPAPFLFEKGKRTVHSYKFIQSFLCQSLFNVSLWENKEGESRAE